MPFDFALIQAIVQHGADFTQNTTVDPGKHPVLREAGVSRVTAYLERLSLYNIITNPVPIFGGGGNMWIGYSLTEHGRELATLEQALRQAVADMIGGPKSEVSQLLVDLIEECTGHDKIKSIPYREDFLASLKEIWICFDNECFNSVIVLCGKIIECCMKQILQQHKIPFGQDFTIATNALFNNVPDGYLPPAFQNIRNIIRSYRATTININQSIPIISRDETIMVIYAMRDVLRRYLAN